MFYLTDVLLLVIYGFNDRPLSGHQLVMEVHQNEKAVRNYGIISLIVWFICGFPLLLPDINDSAHNQEIFLTIK